MADDFHEVKITESAEEAAYFDTNRIPYIVWLNDRNQYSSFPSGAYCVEQLSDIDTQYLDRVYRRFKGIPWDIVETQRLRIREIATEDVMQLYDLYQDESVAKYMDALFPNPEQELEYTKEYIQNVYGFYGFGMWVLEEKESGRVIGRAGLEYREGFDGLELGYMLGVRYQHKGYAYEACNAILSYGISELEQKEYCSFVSRDNTASIRLCQRLGFVPNGTVRLVETNFDGLMIEKEYLQYVYSAC